MHASRDAFSSRKGSRKPCRTHRSCRPCCLSWRAKARRKLRRLLLQLLRPEAAGDDARDAAVSRELFFWRHRRQLMTSVDWRWSMTSEADYLSCCSIPPKTTSDVGDVDYYRCHLRACGRLEVSRSKKAQQQRLVDKIITSFTPS